MARKISNFPASDTRLWLVEFYTFFRIQVKIKLVSRSKKKRIKHWSRIDMHHSKVSSSDQVWNRYQYLWFWKLIILNFDFSTKENCAFLLRDRVLFRICDIIGLLFKNKTAFQRKMFHWRPHPHLWKLCVSAELFIYINSSINHLANS